TSLLEGTDPNRMLGPKMAIEQADYSDAESTGDHGGEGDVVVVQPHQPVIQHRRAGHNLSGAGQHPHGLVNLNRVESHNAPHRTVVARNELTAINQYWLHYRVLKDWGVDRLAEYERHESIDEMKHADVLAERILFLDGLPNFQAIHKLKVGETVEEILKADLAMEQEAIPLLREAIQHCETVRDYVSREVFE
ncbi:bacterioferritin, partial [Pseudomonas sp. 74_A]|uniref:bacterioferritin n=1 Tax=Pseudomonas sp. 74_A TaxID=2813565 RepID=UPI0024352083